MERIWQEGYERVTFFYDSQSKTKSIISVHNTNLGPSLGGTRIYPYKSIDDALHDVLRLSKGMTYKAAIANLPLGGGKSVIMADPATEKNDAMLRAHAGFVNSLGGKYITAEDSGTNAHDIDVMRELTPYVVGTSVEKGGSGDPSPYTARGVLYGIRTCSEEVLKKPLDKCIIAIQGLGNVGTHVARGLAQSGCKLYVTDVDPQKIQRVLAEVKATSVGLDEIVDVECDIFCPNALGGVITRSNVPRLKCKVIAGAANNQLQEDSVGNVLFERGIFYAPDYVINAGGLISVCCEWLKYDAKKRDDLIGRISETISEIIQSSAKKKLPPHAIAKQIAESRFMAR